MSYKTRFRSYYVDKGDTEYKIEIQKKDYTGDASVIYNLAPSPVVVNYVGDRQYIKPVVGSSLSFSFLENKLKGDNYDELFSSALYDYKLLHINNDTSTLLWSGYVKPENLSRTYFDKKRFINLEATDAIADLKDISFSYDGSSARTTILNVVKSALTPIGIELPFKIQLNTRERNYMTVNQNALDKARIDTRKFREIKDNKSIYKDCYSVLEKVLQPFNCQLRQEDGAYYITNFNEVDSSLFTYDWNTLTLQSIANTNNIVDISDFEFATDSNFTKLAPLRYIDITAKNKDTGASLVDGIENWSDPTIWKINAPSYSVDSQGVLNLTNETPGLDCSLAIVPYFDVNGDAGNEYIKVDFEAYCDPIPSRPEQWDGDEMYINVWLKPISGTWVQGDSFYFIRSTFYQAFTSSINANYKAPPINTQYQLYVEIQAPETWNNMYVHIKNFSVTKVSVIDGSTYTSVVYDRNFVGDIGINKNKVEEELYFGDYGGITEQSAITIGNQGSRNWSLYGEDSSSKIQSLYAKTVLKNNRTYRDCIVVTPLLDTTNQIKQGSIIDIGEDNYYTINDYSRDYDNSFVRLTISELLLDEPSIFYFAENKLSSVDGVSTENPMVVQSSGSGTQGTQGIQGMSGGASSQGIQGIQGYQGIQGRQGTNGATGATGSQGTQGEQGVQGTLGIQGYQGYEGVAGAQGPQGTTGPQGIQGVQGIQGRQGIQGQTGIQGIQGIQGRQGTNGATGAQGTTGIQGDQGVQGTLGIQGYQGYEGVAGAQGPQGTTGIQGIQGRQGTIGSQGAQGTEGSQGVQGRQGTQGIQGNSGAGINWTGEWVNDYNYAVGDAVSYNGASYVAIQAGINHLPTDVGYWDLIAQGTQGIQGRQGIQGTTGSGSQGTQGIQGIQGRQGTTGAGTQGTQGIQGIQGIQGRQGTTGAGTQGTQGIQGIQGRQGITGSQGIQGIQGRQGTQGIQGIQGPIALDASIRYRTANYTLVSTDNNYVVEASGTFNVYLPTNLNVGFQTSIINVGPGTITLSPSTGATLFTRDSSTRLTKRYTGASVYKNGSSTWIGIGELY